MPPRRPPFPSPAAGLRGPARPSRYGRRALLPFLLGVSFLALRSPAVVEKPEDKGALPTSPEFERLRVEAKEAERGLHKGEAHFALEMKKAHVYAKVLKHGEAIGRFRPETEATSVRAEISTYNIGRALGCGELFQPAVAMELHGKGLATFRKLLESASFPEVRQSEREGLLEAMDNDPEVLRGAFKPMVPAEAVKYRGAERPDDEPNGGLETGDPIARYLRHDAPQPGHQPVPLPSVSLHLVPAHLARQLSNILLVDALAGQWDRFSGNNLHLLPGHGGQFMAIDNGGADPLNDQGYLERFTRWVTRFDPAVAEQLAALDAFLRKKGSFRGYTNERALATALGIEDPKEWKGFKERVHRVNAHVHVARSGGLFER
ncbi:MAG TPA: hypothetical protein VGO11_11415 [Chthoniobacteraceae bacterium]|jgi:hypothetical protein|nr:hypothetical protein [Chthoniobacteraceae bacterium]